MCCSHNGQEAMHQKPAYQYAMHRRLVIYLCLAFSPIGVV